MAGKNSKIALVTGGIDRLSIALSQHLLEEGIEVRTMLNDGSPKDFKRISKLLDGVEPYVVDFAAPNRENLALLEEASRGVDCIYHLGSAKFEYNAPYDELMLTNVEGTRNIVQACIRANGASASKMRIIYPSTVSVYGKTPHGVRIDEGFPTKPHGYYARSKLLAEQCIRSEVARGGPSYTILRLGAIYGGEYTNAFFRIFELIRKRRLPYMERAKNFVSMIHVDDVVETMLLASRDKRAANRVYNLTDGDTYTMADIVSYSAKALKVRIRYSPVDVLWSMMCELLGLDYGEFEDIKSDRLIDIGRISSEIGFRPSIGIEKGISSLAEQFMKKRK
jgi:nucleoside-diphosphate-sugar epimerase